MYIRLKQFLIEKGADFNLIQVRKICEMYKLDPNVYFFSNKSCLNDNKKT